MLCLAAGNLPVHPTSVLPPIFICAWASQEHTTSHFCNTNCWLFRPASLSCPCTPKVLQHLRQQNTQAHINNEFGDTSLLVLVIKPPVLLAVQDVNERGRNDCECCQDQPAASWFEKKKKGSQMDNDYHIFHVFLRLLAIFRHLSQSSAQCLSCMHMVNWHIRKT